MSLHTVQLLQSQINEMNKSLNQLNWKSYLKQSLQEIKKDIINMKQRENELKQLNNKRLSEIHKLSQILDQYQSKHIIVDILYLDDQLCIVNKPANICIDGDEDITLEKLVLNTLNNTSKIRHCHQLDRCTSGVMIYGLTRKSAAKVSTLFQDRNVIKIYYTIVYGHIGDKLNHFMIDFPVAKSHNDPIREVIGNNGNPGRSAITECFVEKRGYFESIPVSLIKIYLHTGRRHQIRLHLSNIGHPIIGDPTYNHLIHNKFDRMYLDSHKIILNFNKENKTIQVSTNSKYTFSALIIDEKEGKTNDSDKQQKQLLFPKPHSFDTYYYTMIIPFVVNDNCNNNIQILIKKSNKLSMVNYKNKKPRTQTLKSLCWNFVSETCLNPGHCDAAQTMANKLLNDYPKFASYLIDKSRFASNKFNIKDNGDNCNNADNPKYLAHHLASNMRRIVNNHCTILCPPYVIFMVPFDSKIINDKVINENKNLFWCPLLNITDEILSYSPLHLLTINEEKLGMDPLLHFTLSNNYVVSQNWINNQKSVSILKLELNESMLANIYQMKKRKYIDNEPIAILPEKILKDKGKLYLGSIKAAKNIKRLKELNISHIIDCQSKENKFIKKTKNGFTKLCLCLNDSINDNILQYMDKSLEFIANSLNDNKNVFCHCWQGASRSVAIIIGYMMKYHNMTLKQSLEYIEKVRGSFARPNNGFLLQLIKMEKSLYHCNSFQLSSKQIARYHRKILTQKDSEVTTNL